MPEIIDPVLTKTSPKRSFCMTENERFGLVFTKTGSINSGTVNGLCDIVFNRFYRLEIHSLVVGTFDSACELLPQWMKELYLCTVAPLPSL